MDVYASWEMKLWFWTQRLLCGGVLLFLVTPLLVIVPLSFNEGSFLMYPMTGLSLRWYQEFFTSAEWLRSVRNSFIVAPSATVVATLLGTLAAVGLTRANFRGKMLLQALLLSPMIVPVIIVAVSTYLYFLPLGLSDGFVGLILVHAALGAPFVVITVSATLEGFDNNLAQASASLGAGPLTTFARVVLPVIAPGVISGALFAFANSFDEVVVTLLLAGPQQVTLPRQMFGGIRENISPTIAAAATLLLIFSIGLLSTLEALRRRAERMRVRLA